MNENFFDEKLLSKITHDTRKAFMPVKWKDAMQCLIVQFKCNCFSNYKMLFQFGSYPPAARLMLIQCANLWTIQMQQPGKLLNVHRNLERSNYFKWWGVLGNRFTLYFEKFSTTASCRASNKQDSLRLQVNSFLKGFESLQGWEKHVMREIFMMPQASKVLFGNWAMNLTLKLGANESWRRSENVTTF